MAQAIVIGTGFGGLTTAAVLELAGLDVTVLETQVYPGGCAGTFFCKGYRYDSGATMAAGFYPCCPLDRVARAAGIDAWHARLADTAMLVHLPNEMSIPPSFFLIGLRW